MKFNKIKELSLLNRTILFLCILIIILPIISFIWYIFGNFVYDGDKEINNIVENIISNDDDNLTKAIKIAQWEHDNILNTYPDETFLLQPFFNKPPYIKLLTQVYRNSKNPSWIIYTKYGACGEYANLFIRMANFSSLETRLVTFPGEDHAIVEVQINNSFWIPIDGTLKKENISNPDPYFYEKHWWRGNVSRVFYYDANGNECDITNKYTETGYLIVKIIGDNSSPNDYNIDIISTLKGESTINGHPDKNLTFKYELGDNEYEIVVRRSVSWSRGIIEYEDIKVESLLPNQSKEIVMNPDSLRINWFFLLFFVIVSILSFIILKKAFDVGKSIIK